MSNPTVLLLCRDDWANVAYNFQESLRSVGVDALALKERPHAFGYPEEARLWSGVHEVYTAAARSDVIVWMHSQHVDIGVSSTISPNGAIQRFAVFHGGTAYRRNIVGMNQRFNPLVDVTLIQTQDLWNDGAKNTVWMVPGVDLSKFPTPNYYESCYGLSIAHYPRDSKLKGSKAILSALCEVLARQPESSRHIGYSFADNHVPWPANIERMRHCDIYVHALNQNGSWGVTALEAAALGKIVVGQFRQKELYENEFGPCPIVEANTEAELVEQIERLVAMTDNEIVALQQATRKWVEDYHSLQATGNRLVRALNI